jgi:hypothetical protein
MNQEEGIWQAVESGGISGVITFVDSNMSPIDQHLEFIRANLGTTGGNLVLYNLLAKVNQYLYCLRFSLTGPTELIGFVARYLFELDLTTQYVLSSEENLMRFVGEAGRDKIQILEGLCGLPDIILKEDARLKKDQRVMEEEIAKIRASAKKLHFPLNKPDSFAAKARIVGDKLEYEALYKIFSKYIHPSSYSITVGYEDLLIADRLRTMFLSWALIFAIHTFRVIKEATMGGSV